MTEREALKQRLGMEQTNRGSVGFQEALAQPEQEPDDLTIAYMSGVHDGKKQRTWVGLTDEEKTDIWCVVTNRFFVTEDTHVYADAIEAKLKEKNT